MDQYLHELPVGFVLANRYRIERVLGQGGFGITYLAIDNSLNYKVCIKEFFLGGGCYRKPDNSVVSGSTGEVSFSDFKKKFIDEAKELARFNHPGIVRVSDVFEQLGTAYFVMDYIEGPTLGSFIKSYGKLSLPAARNFAEQVLKSLKAIHEKGLLHRDIKPDNILISPDNRIILIDFGSARSFESGKTINHTTVLSPDYAPIEQYSEKAKRGPSSDIYSFGATFYFAITGHKPIRSTERSMTDLIPAETFNPEIGPALSAIISKCMCLKPEDRFQSSQEVLDAVKPEEVWGETQMESIEDAEQPPIEVPRGPDPTHAPTPWTRWLAIPGVALLLFLGYLAYDSMTGNTVGVSKWDTDPKESAEATDEEATATTAEIDSSAGITAQVMEKKQMEEERRKREQERIEAEKLKKDLKAAEQEVREGLLFFEDENGNRLTLEDVEPITRTLKAVSPTRVNFRLQDGERGYFSKDHRGVWTAIFK